MRGFKAFREAYLSADILNSEDFSDFEVRKLRYAIYWAYYENTAYSSIHTWANKYKADNGLYKYIRNIYNPAYRLAEFWRSHIWGGKIDMMAGDGKSTPSALPIITENEDLSPAISQIFKDSNWQIRKDIVTLWGAVMGDVGIEVADDPEREKVYLKVVHPGIIKDVVLDDWGNVKEYTIEEIRKVDGRDVTYTETAKRNGKDVVYETYKDGNPFGWNGNDQNWSMPYGFTPLIVQKHNDVGLPWGWSEFHSARSKFNEVDDLASKLSDQIRKIVHSAWFFAGMEKPKPKKQEEELSSEEKRRQAEKEESPAIYAPPGASAVPMVANLQIADSTAYIATILKTIEQDYPELALDVHNVKGDLSGRALRVNQQPAANKVELRRANYDDALIRAIKMAVSIGAMKGYPGFEKFSENSYENGELEFSIGDRPAFKKDPLDDIEINEKFWTVAVQAKGAGVPLPVYLKREGWSEEDINEVVNSPEYLSRLAAMEQLNQANSTNPPVFDKKGKNNDGTGKQA